MSKAQEVVVPDDIVGKMAAMDLLNKASKSVKDPDRDEYDFDPSDAEKARRKKFAVKSGQAELFKFIKQLTEELAIYQYTSGLPRMGTHDYVLEHLRYYTGSDINNYMLGDNG